MKDYKRYFEIALKSTNETQYWLTVIEEYQGALSKQVEELQNELNEISKIITSAILTMKGKKKIQD